MRIFFLLLGSFLLLDLAAIGLSWRLVKKRWWRWFGMAFAGGQLFALLAVLTSRIKNVRISFPETAWSSFMLWHFFSLLLVAVVAAVAGALGIKRRVFPAPSDEHSVSRRAFLGSAAALAPVFLNIGLTVAASAQSDRFRVRRLTLPIPGLPPALRGMTIAHVSDPHVGELTHGRVLREIVATTNDLRADLICLTGDLINHDMAALPAAMEMVAAMDCPHGVWTIEGNHDLIDDGPRFERTMQESSLNFLLREQATVVVRDHPVQLLGLAWTDRHAANYDAAMAEDVRELLRLRHDEAFSILLAHHPHAFDEAVRSKIPLTLSGHTHGGQIMLNENTGFGPAMFRYWSGVYRRNESSLVVSNGVGNWFPLRINAPAEIIHLTLERA